MSLASATDSDLRYGAARGGTRGARPVVLYRGRAPPKAASRNFWGCANRYMLYNMESYWKGMSPFQTSRQC